MSLMHNILKYWYVLRVENWNGAAGLGKLGNQSSHCFQKNQKSEEQNICEKQLNQSKTNED